MVQELSVLTKTVASNADVQPDWLVTHIKMDVKELHDPSAPLTRNVMASWPVFKDLVSIHAKPYHAAQTHIVSLKNTPLGAAAYQVSRKMIMGCVFQPARTSCVENMHNVWFQLKAAPAPVWKDTMAIHLLEVLAFLMYALPPILVKSLKFAYLEDGKFQLAFSRS